MQVGYLHSRALPDPVVWEVSKREEPPLEKVIGDRVSSQESQFFSGNQKIKVTFKRRLKIKGTMLMTGWELQRAQCPRGESGMGTERWIYRAFWKLETETWEAQVFPGVWPNRTGAEQESRGDLSVVWESDLFMACRTKNILLGNIHV